MDILELIKADHRLVEALFSEIESNDDPQKLYECFNQLYTAVNVHTDVEEQTFYPAIRSYSNTEKLVDEAQQEHNEAKQILEEVSFLSPTSEEFKAKLYDLKQAIQHHMQEEENEVFAQVQEYMSNDKRQQLGREFEMTKNQLQSEVSVAT